jgi:glycosyltransferase involved in cell wall biosynthesis
MNILINSHFFHPSVGGVETMAEGLATEWQSRGHDVRVMTATPLDGQNEITRLDVWRRPSFGERLRLLRWADVCFRNGHALRSLPGPVLTGTPFVTRHARPLSASHLGPVRRIVDKMATLLGQNVGTSTPVAKSIPGPSVQIPNPARSVFEEDGQPDDRREGLLFAGRLVSRKGVDVALRALARLHERGRPLSLTICGDGPARDRLEAMSRELNVADDVNFRGWTEPDELAALYQKSQAALIPSRKEPFGIVVLEAIAGGCPVVASNVGGLPEAVGDCGLLVESENPEVLADAVENILEPGIRSDLRAAMPDHVARHRMETIAGEYLDLLKSVVDSAYK